mmetsp:Transcript_49875/g.139590  ORF Transcript_49875/g.139590 Transcript_49875/m.139590 type:complete len:223 (+) Transcript_49875:1662-2330(+)
MHLRRPSPRAPRRERRVHVLRTCRRPLFAKPLLAARLPLAKLLARAQVGRRLLDSRGLSPVPPLGQWRAPSPLPAALGPELERKNTPRRGRRKSFGNVWPHVRAPTQLAEAAEWAPFAVALRSVHQAALRAKTGQLPASHGPPPSGLASVATTVHRRRPWRRSDCYVVVASLGTRLHCPRRLSKTCVASSASPAALGAGPCSAIAAKGLAPGRHHRLGSGAS